MILLLTENFVELVDINGESCFTLPVEKSYKEIVGNPHNDEYYFALQDDEDSLDTFSFGMRMNRP